MTAEDLLLMKHDDAGKRYELVRGELQEMPPAGGYHGNVAFTITSIIGEYIRGKDLGVGLTAETGFVTGRAPDSVRARTWHSSLRSALLGDEHRMGSYSRVGRRRVTPCYRSTFPSAPLRTGGAAFTASGSPVSLQSGSV